MKKFCSVIFLVLLAVTANAQDGNSLHYYIGKNFVSFNDSLMSSADVATFTDLGNGYAKDKGHVYLNGRVLEHVNPATFSLMDDNVAKPENIAEDQTAVSNSATEVQQKASQDDEDGQPSLLDTILGTDDGVNHYSVDGSTVTYKGKEVKYADAATFKFVGGEYAADKHHAYYKGRLLSDAWGVKQFKYRGNGTATDGVHWYANGKPVDRD